MAVGLDDFREDRVPELLTDGVFEIKLLRVNDDVKELLYVFDTEDVILRHADIVTCSEPLESGDIDCVKVFTDDVEGEGVSEFDCDCVEEAKGDWL